MAKGKKILNMRAGLPRKRSTEVEKAVVSRRKVRLGYWVWEEFGNKLSLLHWKAAQSYKALECQFVSQEIPSIYLNNLPSSGWVWNLTADAAVPAAPTHQLPVAGLNASVWCPPPVTKLNFHRLICDNSFKYPQPSIYCLKHLSKERGASELKTQDKGYSYTA